MPKNCKTPSWPKWDQLGRTTPAHRIPNSTDQAESAATTQPGSPVKAPGQPRQKRWTTSNCRLRTIRSRSANQTKADSRVSSRKRGIFLNSGWLHRKNKETSQKSVQFANLEGFCELSLFFEEKHSKLSEKHPFFANWLANQP